MLDLTPDEHRFLHEELAGNDMDASGIVRALLAIVKDEPELKKRVGELAEPPDRAPSSSSRLLRLIETRGRVVELVELLPTPVLRDWVRTLDERWNTRVSRRAKAISCFSLSFTGTFTVLRAIRYLQEADLFPGGKGLTIRGAHIHHYIWGLALLMTQGLVVTALDLPTGDLDMRYMFPFGAGLALSLDEFDLLLEIENWHWAEDGRPIVDAMIVAAGGLTCAAASHPVWLPERKK